MTTSVRAKLEDRELTEKEQTALELIRKADAIIDEIALLRSKRQALLQEACQLGRVRGLKIVSYRPAQNVPVVSIRLLREYVSDRLLDKCTRSHWVPDSYVVQRAPLSRVTK